MKKFLTFLGWPLLLVPLFLMYLGSSSNQVVEAMNRNQMPVLAPQCWENPAFFAEEPSRLHTCMTKDSKLKFLADWINFPTIIASPGDMIITLGEALAIPCFYAWISIAMICLIYNKNYWL